MYIEDVQGKVPMAGRSSSSGFTLDWNGGALLAASRQAQKTGIEKIAKQCAAAAAADTPVRTGRAQRSLRAAPAQTHGNRTGAAWGSFGVPYYIFLELRANMLRNAADQHYPQLAVLIAERGGG